MDAKPGYVKGRHYTTYVEQVKELKRQKRFEEAESLLLALIDATESEARADRSKPAPWYYEHLAIVYRKMGKTVEAVAIKARYEQLAPPPLAPKTTITKELKGSNVVRKKAGGCCGCLGAGFVGLMIIGMFAPKPKQETPSPPAASLVAPVDNRQKELAIESLIAKRKEADAIAKAKAQAATLARRHAEDLALVRGQQAVIQEHYAEQSRRQEEAETAARYVPPPANREYEYQGGREIHTGPRGGRYYINSHGNKTYIKH